MSGSLFTSHQCITHNAGKLTRFSHCKDWQTDSFLSLDSMDRDAWARVFSFANHLQEWTQLRKAHQGPDTIGIDRLIELFLETTGGAAWPFSFC